MRALRRVAVGVVSAIVLAMPAPVWALDVTVTAANVVPSGAALISEGTAGATIAAGQPLYIDTADANKLKLADCNASATAGAIAGIALGGASSGQRVRYAVQDANFTPGFTVTVGAVYVGSATAGGIAPVADLATGCFTTVLGVGKTSALMNLHPVSAGVAVP